jgi:hypothetical protein
MKSETGKKKPKEDLSEIPQIQSSIKYKRFEGLAVNRAADIEPVIPPSSYLYYRYMHPRGLSH